KMNWARIKGWLTSSTVDGIIRAIVLISIVGMLWLTKQEANTNNCLKHFIDAQSVQNSALRALADEDRKVIDDLVVAIATSKSVQQTREALDQYQIMRKHNDELRAGSVNTVTTEDVC